MPLQCDYSDNQILDCFCCLSAQMGAIGRGDIYYSGFLRFSEVEVENKKTDGTTWTETTRVWQIGGRTPKIICDQGRLRCECVDDEKDWAVYESQCTEGEMCSP